MYSLNVYSVLLFFENFNFKKLQTFVESLVYVLFHREIKIKKISPCCGYAVFLQLQVFNCIKMLQKRPSVLFSGSCSFRL